MCVCVLMNTGYDTQIFVITGLDWWTTVHLCMLSLSNIKMLIVICVTCTL